MNILVINGSPKGKDSITLQTALYLEICNPAHTFRILHAGRQIHALERDFSPAAEALSWADAVIFSFPVYTFLAPSQLHRFIALMKEHRTPVAGKYATVLTTSKHFYDVTAHRYIRDNCRDMGMPFVEGLSADMDDLTCERGREEACAFFARFLWSMERGYAAPEFPLPAPMPRLSASVPNGNEGKKPGDVVIIADLPADGGPLASMVERFRAVLPYATRVVNIREYPFRGGCLGCFHCAPHGRCIYPDGFDTFLREDIQTAQAMIYAFTVTDHSMGDRFKLYDDRQFCNGHRTVTIGMPVGYLVDGSLSGEENLRTVLEARAQVGRNPLTGIASNDADPDAAVDRLADSLTYALEKGMPQPQNFYGVGGMKIFRDLIYQMQGMMRADHRFFRSHGQYDFPQKNRGRILLMYLVGAMMASPALQKKAGGRMTEGMLMPYTKVLREAKEKASGQKNP